MASLSSQRDEQRLIAKRSLPEAETDRAKEAVKELTAEIRGLKHELKVCREIQERSEHVRGNFEIIDRDRQREGKIGTAEVSCGFPRSSTGAAYPRQVFQSNRDEDEPLHHS